MSRPKMTRKKFTNEQIKLQRILTEMGFETILEYVVGKYSIDIFCPELNLGFEYDGPMHSLSKKKDISRDSEIFVDYGIRIMRIWKMPSDIKETIMEFIEGKEEL